MAVFSSTDHLPAFSNAVLTIGTFDGVHKGHIAILNKVVARAEAVDGESVLITFEPHPRKLLFPQQPLGIITPLPDKLRLIQAAGIQHVVVAPFTPAFAALSATQYIEQFLVQKFHPHSIIIGYDHRFGHDRGGNMQLMEQYAARHAFNLVEIPAQLIDEAAVSSTKIRNAIAAGRLEDAAHMLGRPYTLSGTVVHGNKLGRTIGYPTANLQPLDADQVLPANGIYAILALHADILYDGMLSIGYNPTVTDKGALRIEANLFDFDQDIYGHELQLFFIKRLRDEQKFSSLEALTTQLHQDRLDTLDCLR